MRYLFNIHGVSINYTYKGKGDNMKRLSKVYWQAVRRHAHGRLLVKAECRLFDLRSVVIMPVLWHKMGFRTGMMLVEWKRTRRIADWLVHRVPYNVRFDLA